MRLKLGVGALLVLGLLVDNAGALDSPNCSLGRVVADRTLIRPQDNTFYSVDALDPDVVRWRGKYLMFFSGNREHTAVGSWRTGLAISKSPAGPFRVTRRTLPYLNGGTAIWQGRLWQAAERSREPPKSDLLVSDDANRWRKVAPIPQRTGRYRLTADYALEARRGRLRLYAIGRTNPAGLASRLIALDYRRGRWTRPRTLLTGGRAEWESVDLGEPYPFRWHGRSELLYTGTAPAPFARSIGLAVHRRGGWRRCGANPVLPAGSAPWGRSVSIDPAVIATRRRLYVYFGGGRSTSIASDLNGAIGVRIYGPPVRRSTDVSWGRSTSPPE